MIVREEWNETLAKELVAGAQEPHIRQYTPRDSAERFSTAQSAYEWYASAERHTFTIRDNGVLLGICWFSRHPEPIEDAIFTFAIRMYKAGLGKGLAEGFAKSALDQMVTQYEMGSVWLETDETNVRALHLYEKLGFETIKSENGRQLMIKRKKLG